MTRGLRALGFELAGLAQEFEKGALPTQTKQSELEKLIEEIESYPPSTGQRQLLARALRLQKAIENLLSAQAYFRHRAASLACQGPLIEKQPKQSLDLPIAELNLPPYLGRLISDISPKARTVGELEDLLIEDWRGLGKKKKSLLQAALAEFGLHTT